MSSCMTINYSTITLNNSKVSIPQAVGTIAIEIILVKTYQNKSFNTASGRYYCNGTDFVYTNQSLAVSIPQAVGTIAIAKNTLKKALQLY